MSAPKIALPCVALASILFVGCPLGPFSGGRLGGEVQTGPVTDWSFVAEVENCQLETNPEAPHSINCWCAGYRGNVYVPSSMILGPTDPSEREWVQNVRRDPVVRLRVDGRVYERKAVRVDDDAEYAAVLAALEEKYEVDPNEREAEREIWLYRLEAR